MQPRWSFGGGPWLGSMDGAAVAEGFSPTKAAPTVHSPSEMLRRTEPDLETHGALHLMK